MEKWDDVIAGCPLFAGLGGQLTAALSAYSAREKSHPRGEILKGVYRLMPAFGLVLEGTVQVYMDDFDGQPMLMNNVSGGGTFGEALCYLRRESPVYILARENCRVLWLETAWMREDHLEGLKRELEKRFTAMLAERTLSMNDRIQILSKNSLRGKLVALLSQHEKGKGQPFFLPMDRAGMAAYLGADRSALSRELSNLQRQGVLTYHKNRFCLLHEKEEDHDQCL